MLWRPCAVTVHAETHECCDTGPLRVKLPLYVQYCVVLVCTLKPAYTDNDRFGANILWPLYAGGYLLQTGSRCGQK